MKPKFYPGTERDQKLRADSERMQKVLDEFRVTPDELGKLTDSDKGDKIRNILKQRNGISRNLAKDICKAYRELRYEWIMFGEGEMYLSNREIKKRHQNINNQEFVIESLKTDNRKKEKQVESLTQTITGFSEIVTGLKEIISEWKESMEDLKEIIAGLKNK